jgi:hypothetical protein
MIITFVLGLFGLCILALWLYPVINNTGGIHVVQEFSTAQSRGT